MPPTAHYPPPRHPTPPGVLWSLRSELYLPEETQTAVVVFLCLRSIPKLPLLATP